jgi:hypothetical protein
MIGKVSSRRRTKHSHSLFPHHPTVEHQNRAWWVGKQMQKWTKLGSKWLWSEGKKENKVKDIKIIKRKHLERTSEFCSSSKCRNRKELYLKTKKLKTIFNPDWTKKVWKPTKHVKTINPRGKNGHNRQKPTDCSLKKTKVSKSNFYPIFIIYLCFLVEIVKWEEVPTPDEE